MLEPQAKVPETAAPEAVSPSPTSLEHPVQGIPGLPEFQLGLRRIGVVELVGSDAVTVSLGMARTNRYAAVVCSEEAASGLRIDAIVQQHELDCLEGTWASAVPQVRLPDFDTVTLHPDSDGAMTFAVYEEIAYEEYPANAPVEYALWAGETSDTGTTRLFDPVLTEQVGASTWEWDITVQEDSVLEIWATDRGRWKILADGAPISQNPKQMWHFAARDGWWVQWGSPQTIQLDISPSALAPQGIEAPSSRQVSLRVTSDDVDPTAWFLVQRN